MEKTSTSKQILHDNEIEACKVVSIIEILFGFIQIVILLLNVVGILDIYLESDNYILTFIGITNTLIGVLTWVWPKHFKALKYILFAVLIINAGVLDYSFPFITLPFVVMPVCISVVFYDKKLTFAVIIATLLTLLASSLITYFVCVSIEHPKPFEILGINWQDIESVLRTNYLIKILFLFIPFVACFWIAHRGRSNIFKLAKTQTEVNKMENDIQTASVIQQQVLPTDFNSLTPTGIDLFAFMKPAKEVAGDFYDYFEIKDKLYFLIGDVSDKGLYAAMFMMNVKNIIHSISLNNDSVEGIITSANKLICKDNNALMYVTLWFGCYDYKKKTLTYVNAGHEPAFIKDKNGNIKKLESTPQTFVGVFPNYVYKSTVEKINQGDTLFIYTDGVLDAINAEKQSFDENRLLASLSKNFDDSKTLCENITLDISNFVSNNEQFDDITMMSLMFKSYDFDKTFKCDSHDCIDEIIDDVSESLEKANCNIDIINTIGVAIDDLLDNIISYAYEDKSNEFRFQYKIVDRILTIVVSDSGVSFNPTKVREADLSVNRKIGGLGIHLIKNIMDTVDYARTDDHNILVLTKKF